MRFLFLSLLILIFGLLSLNFFFKPNQNSYETQIANWGDGTDAFYKQLLKSNGEFLDNAGNTIFDNKPVQAISKAETESILAQARESQNQVLGLHTASDGTEKWVEIDLSDLKLYAWEGNRKVYEFSTSTGRPGYETPTGEYKVWIKVRSQRYKGGIPGTSGYYNLPNVPYSLFFGGGNVPNWKGYAIHGAYWHNDFGIKNRSSGCINLKPEEAGLLYQWAGPVIPEGVGAINTTEDNPGIRVVIRD